MGLELIPVTTRTVRHWRGKRMVTKSTYSCWAIFQEPQLFYFSKLADPMDWAAWE